MTSATDRSLAELCQRPLVVAPMAGGVSTVDLVVAAAEAGALGFLATGYRSPDDARAEIEAVRRATTAPFGVNLFVPGAPTDEGVSLADYRLRLEPLAEALGTEVGEPVWDDDGFGPKVALLLDLVPAVASFTFGCPSPELVAELRSRGTHVTVTITTPAEATEAAAAGASSLCVQGPAAGAHRGSFTNQLPAPEDPPLLNLLAEVRRTCGLPMVAAGGLAAPEDIATVLAHGAVAAQLGTAFLRCPESGAPQAQKDAMADPASGPTVVTRAFSGRPARAIANRFTDEHPDAPAAYPEINHLTRPLRAAAARQGRAEYLNLYAGTGYRQARAAPAGEIIEWLSGPTARAPKASSSEGRGPRTSSARPTRP